MKEWLAKRSGWWLGCSRDHNTSRQCHETPQKPGEKRQHTWKSYIYAQHATGRHKRHRVLEVLRNHGGYSMKGKASFADGIPSCATSGRVRIVSTNHSGATLASRSSRTRTPSKSKLITAELVAFVIRLSPWFISAANGRNRKIAFPSQFLTHRGISRSEKLKAAYMSKRLYEKFSRDEITDDMLQEAAKLFSENYGIWGKGAASVIGPFAKQGTRVKVNSNRLRNDYVPQNAACSYVRVTIEGQIVGHALACRWKYNDRTVCWVTQLVVHRDYRKRRLATGMLNELREDDDEIYGIASSHAASCLTAAKIFGSTINLVQLEFIHEHAQAIMEASPIKYIRNAKVCGSLFNPDDTSGVISSVHTNFFVDHTEPLEVLQTVRKEMDWPLGELVDGHEFLVVLEVRRRRRSTTRYMSSSS